MSKRSTDVNGDSMASAAAFTKQLVRTGELLMLFELLMERADEDGTWLLDVKFKFPAAEGQEYLAVVRARTEEGSVVAFHSAPTLFEVVTGVLERIKNKSLKFREDKPYGT